MYSLPDFGGVNESGFTCRLITEGDRFSDCEHGGQHGMLVCHTDTCGYHVSWAFENNGLTIDGDLPLVGLIQTVKNVHQSGFARAILTQEYVGVPFFDIEVDVIVCDEEAEALRGPPGFQLH